MNHNQLEIMIYGKDIAKYKPTIANETIQLVEVKNTENDNYLFLKYSIHIKSKIQLLSTIPTARCIGKYRYVIHSLAI